MLKMKIFLVLLFSSVVWAVPFNVEVVKKGDGDEIRSGQLIKVHYKGYLYADIVKFDSLKVAAAAESAEKAKQDSIAAAAKKDSKSKAKDKKAEAPVEAAAADSAVVDEASADTLTPFADTYASGEPLEFTIGVGQVIAGWDKGILGMKVGEIRKLTIPYVMAYGENSLEGIPPYSDLYFEVELVAAEKPLEADVFPKDLNKLKWQDKGKGLKVFTNLKVHYTGWLVSGRKFGSSKDLGKPFEVVLGAGKMIKGWEAGLDGMREGGVRWLRVSPSMGYGASAFTMIPPNSTLVFRIELVESMIDPEIAAKMDFFPDTTTLTFEHGSEGLRYAVIQQGEGEPAKAGANVKVHYTGWLTNGYKFDSSRDRDQAFAFPLGGGRVIRGWDLGVAGMLPGEKRILIIPPGLGYGSRGAGPIPGGATLIFAVEYLGE